MSLWISLKRDRVYADVYYKGEKILTLKVNDQNRGVSAIINLEASEDIKFKIVKDSERTKEIADESVFNKEEYNR